MILSNFLYHMKNFQRVKGYDIDYHIAESCNLNCAGCLHFSSIAAEEYIEIGKLQNQIKILNNTFGSRLRCLKLLGGEPLLHPEINEVLTAARGACGDKVKILLLTNGILLSQMDQTFWNACRDNKIVIGISQYPIKIKYDMLEELARQKCVEFETFAYRDDFWKWKISDKKLSTLRKWRNFFYCSLANKCHTYRDGRLYTCCIAAHIHHFEKKFGFSGLYDVDGNSVSITDSENKIGRFLARPVPMCQYCLIEKKLSFQKWRHSKGEIDEWK